MATIIIPHRGSNQTSQTTPVGDTITVGDTRVRNASQALTVVDSPSWAGSASGRDWNNYFIEGLTGPCQGLYSGIPVVFQNPTTGALFVEYVYNHSGNTSELATAGVVARNQFAGQRGDNFVSPYVTAVDTPRANAADPTLWTCIDLGGWGFHVTATGRVITMFGRALPDGVFPTIGGSRKTLNGTFPDGEMNGPNDICYDPANPLIQYVADTFNDRIMKVEETSPGVVNVSTYWTGGLNDPYSLYAEADGTLIVADRGNNRVIRIPRNGAVGGTPVNIATGLNLPMIVRPFSDGNICCAEHGGTRRLLEITRSNGALREITTIRTQQGVTGTAWIWMDVDFVGTMGPVDDIFTVLSSSFDTLRRTGRNDGFGTTNLNEGFVVNGSALTQGMLNQVQDAQGHYPWAVSVARRKANLFLTGTGSQQYRQMRRAIPGTDVMTALTTTQKARRDRGGRIWSGINFDMTKPSFTLTAGFAGGHNLLGAPNENTETIDAMSWATKAAFIRGGGNGIVDRSLTDVDVQDVAYYIKMNARRGLRDSSIDPVGHAAPPPGEPAPPPPEPPVIRMVAASITVSLEDIPDDPPDPPVPDPVPPPPGTGDLDPGIWTQLVVPSRTVYQPRTFGSQSIAEGQPGCAENVAPNPVSATGTLFRSFSGMAAGAGRVWSIGGGHLGNPGNDVDILDLQSKTWNLPFQAEVPPPYIAGVPNPIWRGIRGGAIATGGFSPTGRPWVHHAYRLMCVDTTRERLMFMSGNGLGCYDTAGIWTQLSGRSKALNEVVCNSTGAPMYDPERDSLWVFAGDTVNGLERGIFEYNITADTWRRVSNWPAVAGWSFASKYISACYAPATREAYLICSPNSTWPEFPMRVFRYQLDTGTLTWEETLKGGAPGNGGLAYEELFHHDNRWGRRVDFRTRTNQLYFYTPAWSTSARTVAAGFWIFTPTEGSGGTWGKLLTPDGPSIAWWTLCYDGQTDLFAGLRARTTYCGVAGSACGGIADTHLFDPSV